MIAGRVGDACPSPMFSSAKGAPSVADTAIRWKPEPHGPWENPPALDYSPHGTALRIARRCLFIVRGCLREDRMERCRRGVLPRGARGDGGRHGRAGKLTRGVEKRVADGVQPGFDLFDRLIRERARSAWYKTRPAWKKTPTGVGQSPALRGTTPGNALLDPPAGFLRRLGSWGLQAGSGSLSFSEMSYFHAFRTGSAEMTRKEDRRIAKGGSDAAAHSDLRPGGQGPGQPGWHRVPATPSSEASRRWRCRSAPSAMPPSPTLARCRGGSTWRF